MPKLTRFTPQSLQGYQRSWLSRDIIAGVTLAAVAIPETMGYTSIAQTPVVTGLYTVIFPTLVFALLGSSRLLVVGADSATAAILAAGLAGLGIAGLTPELRRVAGLDQPRRARLRRPAGPRPAAQARLPRRLPERLGARSASSPASASRCSPGRSPTCSGSRRARATGSSSSGGRSPTSATPTCWTVAFAVGTLAIIIGFKRFLPKVPGAVVAVILSIILSSALDASVARRRGRRRRAGRLPADRAAGGDHLSRHPQGPRDRVLLLRADHRPERRHLTQLRHEARPAGRRQPRHRRAQRRQLRGRAHRHLRGQRQPDQDPDPRRAEGPYPGRQHDDVGRRADRRAVPHRAAHRHAQGGARRDRVPHRRRPDRHQGTASGSGRHGAASSSSPRSPRVVVFAVGVEQGIILAIVLSILEIVRRAVLARSDFLVGVDTGGDADLRQRRRPGTRACPACWSSASTPTLLRQREPVLRRRPGACRRQHPTTVRWLVLDCSSIDDVDYSASLTLAGLISSLHADGRVFALAGTDPQLLETLTRYGTLADFDNTHIYPTVEAAIAAFRSSPTSPAPQGA